MSENHIAQECAPAPEAATDEPASSFNPFAPEAGPRPLPPRDLDRFDFASEEEGCAYWAGVADGMRNSGATPSPRLAARARDHYPELVASAEQRRDLDIIEFDAVSVRHRIDGWTPRKQREYVEALADSGVARYAAARVGMSEQSAARLRRRADARSFDRACEAAMRIGARRLVSVAFERAIEGTIKRRYYHGELTGEERVYDNRLLMSLIAKLPHLFEEPGETPVEQSWEPWMEAIEQALPEPPQSEAEEPAALDEDEDEDPEDAFTGCEAWQDDEGWWTTFPPPPGFDGDEEGRFEELGYRRTLTEAEQRVAKADAEEQEAEERAAQCARRDLYFGFTPESPEAELFPPKGCEPNEPNEPSGPLPAGTVAQAAMS